MVHQESFGCGYQPLARQPRTRTSPLTSSRVMTGEEAAPGGKVRVMTGWRRVGFGCRVWEAELGRVRRELGEAEKRSWWLSQP